MKTTKNAAGNTVIAMNQAEWLSIGKQAQWYPGESDRQDAEDGKAGMTSDLCPKCKVRFDGKSQTCPKCHQPSKALQGNAHSVPALTKEAGLGQWIGRQFAPAQVKQNLAAIQAINKAVKTMTSQLDNIQMLDPKTAAPVKGTDMMGANVLAGLTDFSTRMSQLYSQYSSNPTAGGAAPAAAAPAPLNPTPVAAAPVTPAAPAAAPAATPAATPTPSAPAATTPATTTPAPAAPGAVSAGAFDHAAAISAMPNLNDGQLQQMDAALQKEMARRTAPKKP